MDYYIDVLLKPDAEMRENELLNKVYTKLHKALFNLQAKDIAASFPNYKIKLGDILRIHSSKQQLEQLQYQNWLGGLSGYCNISPISEIPKLVSYRTVSRKQVKMSSAKLRRLIKRGSISDSEVKSYKAKMFSQGLDNPYLELESTSNGNKYRCFIDFGELQNEPVDGTFDLFGLSRKATIPWF